VNQEPIYHREASDTQTAAVAAMQIESQEIWGRPARNCFASDIPKVKAYAHQLSTDDRGKKEQGIEFKTDVPPDRGTRPGLLYWSGDREGVRNEDGYAKIKVKIVFCNQLNQVYVGDE
jgi:hypothetical protein